MATCHMQRCLFRIHNGHLAALRKFSLLSNDDEGRGFVYPFPKDKIKIEVMRSSGAGGQNVNTRETKVAVQINVSDADWISDRTKLSIKSRLDKNGVFRLQDETSRSQYENKKECMNKLYRTLLEHSCIAHEPSAEEIASEAKKSATRTYHYKQQKRLKSYYKKRDGW